MKPAGTIAAVTSLKTNRRSMLAGLAALTLGVRLRAHANEQTEHGGKVMIACFIRYQIDPFQRDEFRKYAETWGRIIPRCGGHLIGYFLPYEGNNDVGWGLIAFESLASYENYRGLLRHDPESVANFTFAQSKRFIVREERTFVEIVGGTFELPAQSGAKK